MLTSKNLEGTMTIRPLRQFNGMDGKPVEFGPKAKTISVPKGLGAELIVNGMAEEAAPAAAAAGGTTETK